MSVKELIEKFGGLTKMSEKTNISIPTIQYWGRINKIPAWRLTYLSQQAEKLGFDIHVFLDENEKGKICS